MAGIFGDETIRLLRETWPTPTMLAEELFSMFTGTNPITIPANSTVSAPANSTVPYLTLGGYTQGNTILQLSSPGLPPINIGLNPDGSLGTDTSTGAVGSKSTTSASANSFPGVVVSGSGANYLMSIYPNGLGGAPVNVNVTQLQIDPGAVIPPGTWAVVLQTSDGSYYMQVPVFLSAP